MHPKGGCVHLFDSLFSWHSTNAKVLNNIHGTLIVNQNLIDVDLNPFSISGLCLDNPLSDAHAAIPALLNSTLERTGFYGGELEIGIFSPCLALIASRDNRTICFLESYNVLLYLL
jgi:hypothetical protein